MKVDLILMTATTLGLVALAVARAVASHGDAWTFVLIYLAVGALLGASEMVTLAVVDDETTRWEVFGAWAWNAVTWLPSRTGHLLRLTAEFARMQEDDTEG